MVSDLGFFFLLGIFYLRVHDATSTAESLESEQAVDGTKTPLSFEVAIQGHSQSWAETASTAKRRVFTSCACVRNCRGGTTNARFKLYADLLLVRIRTSFFLVIISAFTVCTEMQLHALNCQVE